jgi:hypothetical protein
MYLVEMLDHLQKARRILLPMASKQRKLVGRLRKKGIVDCNDL